MKKILAISLILTIVLSFGLSANAALSSNWTALDIWDVDAAGKSEGVITADNDINLALPVADAWWKQAGVAFNSAVDVDNLTVKFVTDAAGDPSPNGYFAVILSKTKPTAWGLPLVRTYSPDVPLDSQLFVSVYGSTAAQNVWVDGIATNDFQTGLITAGADSTISFEVEGTSIKVKVNGTYLTDPETNEVIAYDGSNVLVNGKAYITLAALGYGGSVRENSLVKTINNIAANNYNGESLADNNGGTSSSVTSTPDTASPLVPVAAILTISLFALVIATKKRKA